MTTPPLSAWQLAEQLGDDLIDPADLPVASLELVEAVRDLVAATVATAVEPAVRRDATMTIEGVTAQLRAAAHDPLILLGRHPEGRVENLTQAGSGRLNPQAPALTFEPIDWPDTAEGPVAVEVIGHCRLTHAHSGPPDRAHGGVVATLLDETIGLAATASGGRGLTAGVNIRYRTGTPLHRPLEIRARYERSHGRKHIATGEIRVDGEITAEAEGIFIAPTASPHTR